MVSSLEDRETQELLVCSIRCGFGRPTTKFRWQATAQVTGQSDYRDAVVVHHCMLCPITRLAHQRDRKSILRGGKSQLDHGAKEERTKFRIRHCTRVKNVCWSCNCSLQGGQIAKAATEGERDVIVPHGPSLNSDIWSLIPPHTYGHGIRLAPSSKTLGG